MDVMSTVGNGWDREKGEVMYRLTELSRLIEALRQENSRQYQEVVAKIERIQEERIAKLEVKVGQLEVKAGIFGGIGGLLAAAVVIGAQLLGSGQ